MTRYTCDAARQDPRILFHYGAIHDRTVGKGTLVVDSHRSIDGEVLVPEGRTAAEYVQEHSAEWDLFEKHANRANDCALQGKIEETETNLAILRVLNERLKLEGVDKFAEFLRKNAALPKD